MVHAAAASRRRRGGRRRSPARRSIGPGATNMITGAALATINRLPVLLLPGDTTRRGARGRCCSSSSTRRRATSSVNDCFRPVARFFDRIVRPEQLLTALPEAMRVLTEPGRDRRGRDRAAAGRPVARPTTSPTRFFEPRVVADRAAAAGPGARSRRRSSCCAARERPLIIAGGGVRYSRGRGRAGGVRRRASASRSPRRSRGKGAVRADALVRARRPRARGQPGARTRSPRDADLVIAVGTRLTDFATGSHSLFQHPDVRFVAINVDAPRRAQAGRAARRGRRARGARARCADGARRRGLEPRPRLPRRRRRGAATAGASSRERGSPTHVEGERDEPGAS